MNLRLSLNRSPHPQPLSRGRGEPEVGHGKRGNDFVGLEFKTCRRLSTSCHEAL
jgi:hypothetical protein